ncbi:MAG: class I SAM-dependent methyltransferase [Myxococcales bacterium]|nr:class I SAM-dependent methyltransferase [Myxococcales bacterium]MBK7192943.1 class I SAM-dependent methyltransferase [Myxococcales bacterium]MBP6844654.1 class I SAM-dependent methyltransferase [Kofleriaceae bacterium]
MSAAGFDATGASLLEIIAHLDGALAGDAPEAWLIALDPDATAGAFPGEPIAGGRHRPLRVWVELADRLGLRLRGPRPAGPGRLAIGFARRTTAPAPAVVDDDPRERYGAASAFARLDKREEPGFVLDLAEALERARLPPRPRVLELGVNTGDAIALLLALHPGLAPQVVGVDHSASALAVARARFADRDVALHAADLADLPTLPVGRFDLVLAIGVLQSPGVDDRALLRHVVQERLTPTGAVILGVPNCRYRDGELAHGARMRNFRQPELGLVIKDVAFYRKYLQQHDREVFVTGHHDLFVTGVARASRDLR